jgi:hypothetical protein
MNCIFIFTEFLTRVTQREGTDNGIAYHFEYLITSAFSGVRSIFSFARSALSAIVFLSIYILYLHCIITNFNNFYIVFTRFDCDFDKYPWSSVI